MGRNQTAEIDRFVVASIKVFFSEAQDTAHNIYSLCGFKEDEVESNWLIFACIVIAKD